MADLTRPLAIGIAGDSAAGKTTLGLALVGLFGERAVVRVAGDDYHRWQRDDPAWGAMTHLHPDASRLAEMTRDVLALLAGRAIVGRRYVHETGRFGEPLALSSNDIVLASGLHVLHPPALVERLDVRVFLAPEEPLRRHFKLRRDVAERGHRPEEVLAALERRAPDAARFIAPQAARADVVLSLRAADRRQITPGSDVTAPRLELDVALRDEDLRAAIAHALGDVAGLSVGGGGARDGLALEPQPTSFRGAVAAADIARAAHALAPDLGALLDRAPRWLGGMTGLMQMVVLARADRALRCRR